MKRFLGILACGMFNAMFLFISCNKNQDISSSTISPPPPPIPSNDTLKGREFIFEKNWIYWKGASGYEEMFAIVNPSDSFSISSMTGYKTEIVIQIDTLSAWIVIPNWQWCIGTGIPVSDPRKHSDNGYVWYFGRCPYQTSHDFWIEGLEPINSQVANKQVRIKVKFL